jgi:CheY-like chemotaxis protein
MDAQLSGRRILIVEDEPMVAWVLDDMLNDFGCAVVGTADRIEEAVAMIGEHDIDAVVLDVNLRSVMSYPVADMLVARRVPFVFTTGYARTRLLEAYRAFPYLLKPYHRSAMREALLGLFAPPVRAASQGRNQDAREHRPELTDIDLGRAAEPGHQWRAVRHKPGPPAG